ncbi:MAG: hypothetical protein JW969_06015 [Spirochaetales bacterium]|nr:hypothetical protein [Spirochaetales bacterium]
MPITEFDLANEVKAFKEKNFDVIYSNEYFPYLRFYDIGAIVFWARVIKWEFPNFSVENCFKELYELELERKNKGYIESKQHRFIIVARKKNEAKT